MLLTKPPMGWNSWNTFGENINEQVVRETAEIMAKNGLRDAGYEYVVIDDCWSERTRGKDGKLRADPKKFPSGMKALADYVHSLGLKLGMYSCAGALTCAQYPGSYEHEYTDAQTFAEWGIDYLKYDYCFHSSTVPGKYLYRRMGTALANSGRDIVLSACSWGIDKTPEWIDATGAALWRSTGDINDSWASIRDIVKQQYKILPYGGAGCYNDMDMLVTGMNGKGNVGFAGCTYEEYKTHMSVWAILASPLMIGCDVRALDKETTELLTNPEMIAVSQDGRAAKAYIANEPDSWENLPDWYSPVFCRLLENGDIAVCMVNLTDTRASMWFVSDQLGVPFGSGKTLHFRDIWSGETFTMRNETLALQLEPHCCKFYRVSVKD